MAENSYRLTTHTAIKSKHLLYKRKNRKYRKYGPNSPKLIFPLGFSLTTPNGGSKLAPPPPPSAI
jgi:hypothetical protein